MRAVVAERPGGPEVLRLREVPRPSARPGWTLVRIMAFGLNRSELFTRRGWSPGVELPRILGIEGVGVVAESLDPTLTEGTAVATVMGGLGRRFDGAYAEYTLVPTEQLLPVRTSLPWPLVAAVPEAWLTAHGSLESLEARPGQRLLVRGATSGVGMAALALARDRGLEVAGTTRDPAKAVAVRAAGAHHVVPDQGEALPERVREVWSDGADRVLDLVGGPAVRASLRALAPRGRVCCTGCLSDEWIIPSFEPLEDIPSGAALTTFSSSTVHDGDWAAPALQEILDRVADGSVRPALDRVFHLPELPDAHRYMEDNRAAGKVVVSNVPGE
ncbi:zinc-binding dehydrogenase [Streptomyces sp. TR1341]|nr:zinc-binding dehydrogenase [Streptomyces sp. TR1341]